jgi:hypothetical protein
MELGPMRPEYRDPTVKEKRTSAGKAQRAEEARYAREAEENQARLRREFLERQEKAK